MSRLFFGVHVATTIGKGVVDPALDGVIMLRKKPVKTDLTRKKEDGIAISDHHQSWESVIFYIPASYYVILIRL